MRSQWVMSAVVAGCLGVWSVSSQAQDTAKTFADVLELSGTVEVYRGGGADWTAVSKGERLQEQDSVSTGEESTAELEFHDRHQLQMRANTEMSIRQLYRRVKPAAEGTELELKRGEILSNVKKLSGEGSIYTIHTPTATSSVRGTKFAVKVYQDENGEWQTEVKLFEGIVEIADETGKMLELASGEQASISALGVPAAPQSIPAAEQQQYQDSFNTIEGSDSGQTGLEGALEDFGANVEGAIEGMEQQADSIVVPQEIDNDDDDDEDLFD